MHHISLVSAPYFFRFCRIYAIIAIKMILSFINIRLVPGGVLRTSGYALGFQHFPRDLVNVNEWKVIFDPYIDDIIFFSKLFVG